MDAVASWRVDRRMLWTAALLVAALAAGAVIAAGAGHTHSAPVPRPHADGGVLHASGLLADGGVIHAYGVLADGGVLHSNAAPNTDGVIHTE